MNEDEIKQIIRRDLGLRPDIKLFSNPCGNGFVGQETKRTADSVLIKNPRRQVFGLFVGSSDLIGWVIIDGVAVFASFEVKTKTGKPRPEQINWIEQVRASGGIAGIVRSTADVLYLIDVYKKKLPWPAIA